ncbi:MAG: NAD(P)-dependent dehydrogenase (short-subunit alcohol dehydrogenase family) [Alphaproteobacteria bacterium]|jgi:NAD(P)-dependent dehydrogenase (short-subunit alcohol dehydrogenase family)
MTDINSEALDQEIDDEGQRIVRDHLKPGDVVVVTGAARGFGRAIARRLARGGAMLAIWDIVAEDGQKTVEICKAAGAPDAAFFACDMGDAGNIESAAAAVRDKFGTIYAVVNNAGIHPRSPALTVPLEMWNRTLAVNLTGSFLTAQAFAPSMIEAGRGAVINLASGRAIQGAKMGIHYAASKAGIIAMTKTLAQEWAEHGIRVNAIIPGVSETRQPLEASGVTLENLRERGKNVPLGRVGHPDDIAGMVAMLLSEDAAFMTGQSVAINGGAIMLP